MFKCTVLTCKCEVNIRKEFVNFLLVITYLFVIEMLYSEARVKDHNFRELLIKKEKLMMSPKIKDFRKGEY